MRKLIHSNFELDISGYKITDTEENPWFLDEIPLKFTFPFEIDLNDENDRNFGFISSYLNQPETIYPLIFSNGDQMEEAELELEELTGTRLNATLTYGLEQLPSWDKKLSELPLDNFDLVGETIYEHAKDIISQTWPDVNYNFPQIHIDTIDSEEENWLDFEGRINNYNGTSFPANYVDPIEYTPVNKTILQPLPYWLHILIKGFELAGLTLVGDILTDARLLKKCVYTPKEYFVKRENPELGTLLYGQDYESIIHSGGYGEFGEYEVIIDVNIWGKFNLLGVINTLSGGFGSGAPAPEAQIYFNGTNIWSSPGTLGGENNMDVDVIFTSNETDPNELRIWCRSKVVTDYTIFDLQLLPLELYDSEGDSIPTIINENKVDLTKAVPDVTFGEFVKATLNWYNYDYVIDGEKVTMNLVESEINYDNAFDLSAFEVKEPSRRFRKNYSYYLKFAEATNDFGYIFEQVFQSNDGVFYSGFKTDEKTSTIEINALPLPLLERKGITTAHGFETSDTKIYAVIYDGLTNNLNLAKSSEEILLPAVHATNWQKWFDFRINAQEFKWPFKAFFEQLIGLKAKGKVFAYGRYHIVKRIQKTEIKPELYEIEIETETMP
jgi:hypothetical protein